MTGYYRRSTRYLDAPPDEYRHLLNDGNGATAGPPREQLSWWQAWGERTFYLVVFITFVVLLVLGGLRA